VRTRIWRIRAESAPKREVPNLAKVSWDELGKHFDAPNRWEANAARFEWIDRGRSELLDVTGQRLVENLLSKAHSSEFRLQWVWALEATRRLGTLTAAVRPSIWSETLATLLEDPDNAIRRETVRALAAADFPYGDALARLAISCIGDGDVDVRIAAIQTLTRHSGFDENGALLQFASATRAPHVATSSERFERALIRGALEASRMKLNAFLSKRDVSLSVEGRVLAYLALEPRDGAPRLARLIPELNRALVPEEIGLLMSNRAEADVRNALQRLLADGRQQLGVLTSLATTDRNRITLGDDSGPLRGEIVTAARQTLQRESSDANRAFVVKLARNLSLIELEPEVIAYLASTGRKPSDQVEALKALREMGSAQVNLFQKFATGENEELRREAVLGIASAKSDEVVPALVTLWPRLPPALRKLALERVTSLPQHAMPLVAAIRDGFISADDLDVAILDRLSAQLGANDPALASVIGELKSAVQPVLRLNGKPGDIAETRIDLRGPFTIETWIRLEPGIDNNDNVLGRKGGADINFYDAKLRLYGGAHVHDVVVAKTPAKAAVWTHVAISRDDAGTIQLYLNGELDAQSAKPFHDPLTGLNIGETNPGGGCAAAYTEFRIWDVARSADEIRDGFVLRLDGDARPKHLVRYMSAGEGWGALKGTARIEQTRDFPELLTRADAEKLAGKFATYRALANDTNGTATRGRDLFAGLCMTCHAVNGQGANIGPNLSGAGAMGIEALLRNILTPNVQLESGYYRYDAELRNGEIVSGFLVTQNADAVVIRPIGAPDRTIARANLKKLVMTKKSLMPEGLLEGLPQESVRDLFAYLRTLK
jgi:putative heme-binding domain-containing protein